MRKYRPLECAPKGNTAGNGGNYGKENRNKLRQ